MRPVVHCIEAAFSGAVDCCNACLRCNHGSFCFYLERLHLEMILYSMLPRKRLSLVANALLKPGSSDPASCQRADSVVTGLAWRMFINSAMCISDCCMPTGVMHGHDGIFRACSLMYETQLPAGTAAVHQRQRGWLHAASDVGPAVPVIFLSAHACEHIGPNLAPCQPTMQGRGSRQLCRLSLHAT